MKTLIAIPVHNEEKAIADVLRQTLTEAEAVLVVDDGSTDRTPEVLREFPSVQVLRHSVNRGYGGALLSAFDYTVREGYDAVITLDSDGQHAPALIPDFAKLAADYDIVSGSRYLVEFPNDTPAPIERRRINLLVTDQLNACFGLGLTDSFCGYKAYRASALARLRLTEDGYGMPLELWVQAACLGLKITELAVPRLYLDPNRTFGENLDDANRRIAYYQEVIDRAILRVRENRRCGQKHMPTPILAPVGN